MQWKKPAMIATCLTLSVITLFWFLPAQADGRWGANYFPNVEVTDQNGKVHHFYDDLIKGKTVAIEQFYTHCIDICPLETARLLQVQKILGDRVGKDIFFYSISIDPEHDTPEVLKEYTEKYHVGPGWLFLTGKKQDIDLISRKLGFQPPELNGRDGHAPHLMIGNEPSGQWLRNNALDNPGFMATMMTDWMNNWRNGSRLDTSRSYAEAERIKGYDHGRYLFHAECAPCHTIGQGDSIGPDLRGVTRVRDREWLRKIVQTPEVLLDGGDPLANALLTKYKGVRMPNLHFDDETTGLLIGYMEKQSAALNAQAATQKATQEATQARPE